MLGSPGACFSPERVSQLFRKQVNQPGPQLAEVAEGDGVRGVLSGLVDAELQLSELRCPVNAPQRHRAQASWLFR